MTGKKPGMGIMQVDSRLHDGDPKQGKGKGFFKWWRFFVAVVVVIHDIRHVPANRDAKLVVDDHPPSSQSQNI